MQAQRDIFEIWGGYPTLAVELDEKPDTVYRWRKRRRIPEWVWPDLIESAASRGVELTADELLRFNHSQGRARQKNRKNRLLRSV